MVASSRANPGIAFENKEVNGGGLRRNKTKGGDGKKKNSQDVKYFVQLLGSDKHAVHDRIWKIEKIKERSDRMRKCGACNPMERSAGASLDSE